MPRGRRTINADKLRADKEIVIKDYLSGTSASLLSQRYSVGVGTVMAVLNENGITQRPRIVANRRFDINEKYFEKIDSHEKAQVLGFIYADGNVAPVGEAGYLRIEINTIDQDYLEHIGHVVGYEGSVIPTRKGRCCRLVIGCKQFVHDLTRLGAMPNKSLILRFPTEEQVPLEFLPSFLLGYMEGDGSIYEQKTRQAYTNTTVSMIGTLDFVSKFKSYIESIGISSSSISPHKSIFRTIIHGPHNSVRFLDHIYANAAFVMKRKYDRYMVGKNKPPRLGNIKGCHKPKWTEERRNRQLGIPTLSV